MKKITGLLLLAAFTMMFACASPGVRTEKLGTAGMAEGFLNISGEKVALTSSYAVLRKGQTSIILLDRAVPPDALGSDKRLTELGETGELSAIKAVIESGKASEVFFYDSRLPSGLSVKELGVFTPKNVTDEMVSGTLVMDDPGFAFGYNVSFSAGVYRIPDREPVSPGPDASVEDQALAALKNQDIDFDEGTFRGKIQDGDAAAVKLFLEAGMTLEPEGIPAIATAVQWGHAEVVELLIDAGSGVNVSDEGGQSLVMQTVSAGKLEVLNALIRGGADVNTPNMYKTTPLSVAAGQGNIEIVRALIHAGAKVNARTTSGWTALESAVFGGHADIVKLLIDSGADVARDRKDPLDIARKKKHKEIERLIIKATAKRKK